MKALVANAALVLVLGVSAPATARIDLFDINDCDIVGTEGPDVLHGTDGPERLAGRGLR